MEFQDNRPGPRRPAVQALSAWAMASALCLTLGLHGVTQAQPAAAASATTPAAPPDMATLKQRLAADDRRRPVASVALAQQALAAPGLSEEDRRWLRTHLARDLIRLNRTDEALAQADLGGREARSEQERLHFERLAMAALDEARRPGDLLKRYESIASRLPPLADDKAGADARLVAADAWRLAGAALQNLARLPEATELLTRALRILDERPDAVYEHAQALTSMALVHSRSGRADEALRTEQRAIDIAEAAGGRVGLSSYYLRKAHFLSLLGRTDEQYDTLLRARAAAHDELKTYNLAVAATNLADVALQKKDYRGALSHAEEAIPLVERSGGKEPLWVCWVNKGIALNRLGRPGGIEWIRKAIAAFAAEPGLAANAAEVHGLLAEELAHAHDYHKAYEAAMQFKRLTDEVRQAADHKRIAEAQAAYEADKRQRQIEALEQESKNQQRFRWLLALAAVAGLAAAAVAAVSRYHVKKAYGAMRDMAFSDPLTGLRNRRHLVDTIDSDLAQARRLRAGARGDAARPNAGLVFMMIDVDHFKAVNDVHGHAAGDAVLKQCAAVLQRQLRESDTLVRWGGEEFLVLARQTNPDEVHVLAERLRASIAAHDFVLDDGQVLRKTCSIGFAAHPPDDAGGTPADWHDTVSLADQCLYVAKTSGRDLWVGVVAHTAVPGREAPGPQDLRAGVESGALTLCSGEGRRIAWPEGAPTSSS